MEYEGIADVRAEVDLWAQLDDLRQNSLMPESQFLSFSRDRGVPAFGVVEGEPGEFVRREWMLCDKLDTDGKSPLFHPFRVFPLHRILDRCDLRIANQVSLNPDGYIRLAEKELRRIPGDNEFRRLGREWGRVVDLSTLLEPLYWPSIVGSRRGSPGRSERDTQRDLAAFREKTLEFLRVQEPTLWRRVHHCMLVDASHLDDNPYLYVLLRAAKWDRRQDLRGPVSGALWLRHMAEVIRSGFEEALGELWPDEVAGNWASGARKRIFGAERPFDNVMRTKPFVANAFGLFTGSSVRWYVEGDTEYFAFQELLYDEPAYYGIELLNLKGEIAGRKGNIALKLEGLLKEDRRLRRFSMISLDGDVDENRRFVSKQIKEDNLVGGLAVHKPDFEFSNFSLTELVEIAATMDESLGVGATTIREAPIGAIATAKELETWYFSVSARTGANLKTAAWGRALGKYAIGQQTLADGSERPIIRQMRGAMWGLVSQLRNSLPALHPGP